jgi:hypothetical protein
MLPGGAWAQESEAEASPTWFDTLRDPTVLSCRAGLGYEHADQDYGAQRDKLTVSGAYAFGTEGRRDWTVSAELPWLHEEPGDTGGERATGVGDFKLGGGHVFDGRGRFRWGLGAAATLPTASEAQLGDGVVKLSPIGGAGFRLLPGLECVGNLQYNASVHEQDGRTPVQSLEAKPALIKTWPRHWYTLAGWDSRWDFENGNAYRGVAKVEAGKALGQRQRWVAYLGCDVPVVNAGSDNLTLKAGINHVFK